VAVVEEEYTAMIIRRASLFGILLVAAFLIPGCFFPLPPSADASFYDAYCYVFSRSAPPGCTVEIYYSVENTGDLPLASVSFEARWWNWKNETIQTHAWTVSLLTGYYERPLIPDEARDLLERFSLNSTHLLGYEGWTMRITALEAYSD
jgi:hypothetical protein